MKLILENWRNLINEKVVDLPNKATAEERYESYRKHMDAAIEQIEFLEEILKTGLRRSRRLYILRKI